LGPSDEAERDASRSPCSHPSLTQPHPACKVRVLKWHGVSEGESEVGQILLLFWICHPW